MRVFINLYFSVVYWWIIYALFFQNTAAKRDTVKATSLCRVRTLSSYVLIIPLQLMTPDLSRQVSNAPEQLLVWDLRQKCRTCQQPCINAFYLFIFLRLKKLICKTHSTMKTTLIWENYLADLQIAKKSFSQDLISSPADWLHDRAALEMQPKLQRTFGKKMTRKYTTVRQIKTPTHQHWPLQQTLENIKF